MGGLFSAPDVKVPKIGGKGKKSAKSHKSHKGKKSAKGRKSRYGEEDYEDEAYEDEFTEERVMSGFVPGVYMTDAYTNHQNYGMTAEGLPASVTKTGVPTKPPAAGKSPFANGPIAGALSDAFPVSNFANNQPSQPGINLADATPLSPMERVVYPMNFSLALLVILFVVFVTMRK